MEKIQVQYGIVAMFCLTVLAMVYLNRNVEHMNPLSVQYDIVEEVQEWHEMNTPKGSYLIDPVVLDIDELSFEEAFRICRQGKGPNSTFFWRGTWYSTEMKTDEQ